MVSIALVCLIRTMPFLFVAVDPGDAHGVCRSSTRAHWVMNHTFRNNEIPFKLDPGAAILAATGCRSPLAWQVWQKETRWMVIAVWLTPADIACLFMQNQIYWRGGGIHVSTCLLRQPDEVVGAFVLIVGLSLQTCLKQIRSAR